MVEIALLMPFLLTLLIGLLEYGWIFFKFQQVNGAARHGARIGVTVPATQAQVTSAISQLMTSAGLGSSGYSVTLSGDPAAMAPGETLTVNVSVPYSNIELTGFPLIPVPAALVGSTSMRKEGVP